MAETQASGPNPSSKSGSRRQRPRRIGRSRKGRVAETAPLTDTADNWDISQFKVAPTEGKTRFHDFNLPNPVMHAIADLGFQYCTPVQAEILPGTLNGKDATGKAQTGTGKTAAFLIALITRLLNNPLQENRKPGTPRTLILAPTRELVLQITEEARTLSKYNDLRIVSVFGGMDYQKQRNQLAAGPTDMIIATPGRLLDFQRRRDINLNKVEVLVIDEADRMLDMGFIPDIRKIVHSTPTKDKRQTLFFSATLTAAVTRLAIQWTRDPISVEIEPEQIAVDTVEQVVYIVIKDEKFALLYNIIHLQKLEQVLVFCNRRDEVRKLAERLSRYGIDCAILSGEVPQQKRISRLDGFKAGKIRVLVATDVAGRGIHIEGMKHVINFTLPYDPEDYVHRIGRTGRAGSTGTSISFADEMDAFHIPDIETFIEQELRCTTPDPDWLILPEAPPQKKRSASQHPKTASGSRKPPRSNHRPRKQRPRRTGSYSQPRTASKGSD